MRIDKILEVHANHVKAIASSVSGLGVYPLNNHTVDLVYDINTKEWVCITNNKVVDKPLGSALTSIVAGAKQLWSADFKE